MSDGAAVTLRGATLRFGHHAVWENLDLDVTPGECLAILGPNGSGKTTLLQVLLGLLPLTAGAVSIDGHPPRRGSPAVGYVPQQHAFDRDLPVRGRDLVQFGLDGHRRGLPRTRSRQVDAAVAAVGATAYAGAPIGQLSGGEQQRLRIAQALVGEPRLLLCDEPLLSLDPSSQQEVVSLINQYRQTRGATVVFVTHELNPVVRVVDRVLYVASGRWAAGSTEDVMTTETLSALYGAHIDVIRVHDRLVVVGGEGPGGIGTHHFDAEPADARLDHDHHHPHGGPHRR
ncbi:MAG TPA: metal ABC transporter ATP-binding protein [Acidimicrobiales bacterium]|nr:metal ABC transporter ATP-binding protein [Acidimicrobiales bacterium]